MDIFNNARLKFIVIKNVQPRLNVESVIINLVIAKLNAYTFFNKILGDSLMASGLSSHNTLKGVVPS